MFWKDVNDIQSNSETTFIHMLCITDLEISNSLVLHSVTTSIAFTSSHNFPSTISHFPFYYDTPVQRRGISTAEGADPPSSFSAITEAWILPLPRVAISDRFNGAVEVSGEKFTVCCRFSSEL